MGLGKGRTISFKDDYPFDKRLEESKSIATKYPDRVPVIIERYRARRSGKEKVMLPCTVFFTRCQLQSSSQSYFQIQILYLVPRDMSVGQFIHVLSSRLQLAPGKALFVFVKNTLPPTVSRMDSVYQSYKDDDGFLYMCYSTEKTFG